MSQRPTSNTPVPPKTERWVLVMALTFIPVIGALMVPEAARIPLLVIAALMFIVGFALMLRESRRSDANESLRRLVHDRDSG